MDFDATTSEISSASGEETGGSMTMMSVSVTEPGFTGSESDANLGTDSQEGMQNSTDTSSEMINLSVSPTQTSTHEDDDATSVNSTPDLPASSGHTESETTEDEEQGTGSQSTPTLAMSTETEDETTAWNMNITSGAGNESEHETPLSFVIEADYKQMLANDSAKERVLREIRQQLAAVLKVPTQRIVRLALEPGSIIVRFVVLGPRVYTMPRIRYFMTLCNRRRFFIYIWRRPCLVIRPFCRPCIYFPVGLRLGVAFSLPNNFFLDQDLTSRCESASC